MKRLIWLLVLCLLALPLAGEASDNSSSTEASCQRCQCHSVTKSGNRCKRKAVAGRLYCRQHSVPAPAKVPNAQCGYVSDDGKRCPAPVVPSSRFCDKHSEKASR